MKVKKVIKKLFMKKCKSCQNKCLWNHKFYEDLESMEVSK